jgi:hypothetical protein
MLVASLIGLAAVVGAAFYFVKRMKREDDVYVDGSTLTYDDIYPVELTSETPPPVVEPVVKKVAKKKVASKKIVVKKKRGRPAKKKTKK